MSGGLVRDMAERMERYIKGTCKTLECRATVNFAIGGMTLEEVKARLGKRRGYECPGGPHMELGLMMDGYEWDFTVVEKPAPPTDEEWVDRLGQSGYRVLCGDRGRYPEFTNLHGLGDLRHVGFGSFESDTYRYERRDSPSGTRYYLEIPKQPEGDPEGGVPNE